ncbi:unnamed protein product [Parnassius apollo]|uniref:(apollo) hypothetical protein n=1 Tax=Parnassius apollo TaxID=110799 RepID=A0A8S3XNC7_PARAO|nr:unnamed protein product [Parnassius apollo]
MRKKMLVHNISDSVILPSNTAQETTPVSTPASTESGKETTDTFSDGLTIDETLLSKSMDYTMTEVVSIQDMRDIIEQLRMDLATTQNELENIILDNNDLRSQVTNLIKENNTLKAFLSKTPPKKSKSNCSTKKKIRSSPRYSDVNIIATPPRASSDNKTEEFSNRNILTLEQNLKDLELQLKLAKNEIADLNNQIITLQKAVHAKEFEESSLIQHTINLNSEIDKTSINYMIKVENDIAREPSNFWKYVKEKRKNRQQNKEFVYNNRTLEGQQAIDAFAQYFSSVFQPDTPFLNAEAAKRDAMYADCVTKVSINIIKASDLRWAIRRLKASAACGSDNIPSFLIKDCMAVLEEPLLYVYNLSLQQCLYPNA